MEIEINGHEYRSQKLNVFDQLKVTRKLLPVLSGLTGELQKLQQGEMPMAAVLPIMANSIAQMSDEDCNAILHPCLAVVSRKNAKAWTPIFRQGELMFDDIDLKTMLEIVAQVIGDSLGNFFHAPQGDETASLLSQD
ncbi:phage tail assembly chaperone [Arsenophonus endosymbiont of Crataerina pallida]|uniref:phage tail assembly chaperone n=1 Tax=Arsenophonus endosymbiont of Crataerina pallida TaxID=3066235 RepID=UPI0030CAD9ED